jgi:hypothetical protein
MRAETFESSTNAGFGIAERGSFGLPGVPSAGASLAWAGRVQFDYTFGRIERNVIDYDRQWFTGSYVIQPHHGRARPFLQFGAGIQYETNNANHIVHRDLGDDSRTAFAGIIGAGVTVGSGTRRLCGRGSARISRRGRIGP